MFSAVAGCSSSPLPGSDAARGRPPELGTAQPLGRLLPPPVPSPFPASGVGPGHAPDRCHPRKVPGRAVWHGQGRPRRWQPLARGGSSRASEGQGKRLARRGRELGTLQPLRAGSRAAATAAAPGASTAGAAVPQRPRCSEPRASCSSSEAAPASRATGKARVPGGSSRRAGH